MSHDRQRQSTDTQGPGEDPQALSLTELAARLESITRQIEAERNRERKAREQWEEVARDAQERIREIRVLAAKLLEEQRRRVAAFEHLAGDAPSEFSLSEIKPFDRDRPRTIDEAVMAVWALDDARMPLTSEVVTERLHLTGYETRAAPKSLRSTVNQAIARLCQSGRLLKLRGDGTHLDSSNPAARARKYVPARLQEDGRD